jgi:branched-chain amino acid transport system ATP-binding protein
MMAAIMAVCTRVLVLHRGRKLAEGTPKEISSNQEVIKAYLGTKYAELYSSADQVRG